MHVTAARLRVPPPGLLLLMMVAMLTLVRPAPAQAVGERWYEVRARHSEKCLDVAHMSTAHTANVIQGTCWGGYNQQWQFRQIY